MSHLIEKEILRRNEILERMEDKIGIETLTDRLMDNRIMNSIICIAKMSSQVTE